MKKAVLPLIVLTSLLASCGKLNTPDSIVINPIQPSVPTSASDNFMSNVSQLSNNQLKEISKRFTDWESVNPDTSETEKVEYLNSLLKEKLGSRMSAQVAGDIGPNLSAFCAKSISNRTKCLVSWTYHNDAIYFADENYHTGMNGGLNDAARHLYWSASMTKRYGAAWAKSVTDAYEADEAPTPGDQVGALLSQMDYHNNEVGRFIGQVYDDIKQTILLDIAGNVATVMNSTCSALVSSGSPNIFTGIKCQ